jgi:hypothetical protein
MENIPARKNIKKEKRKKEAESMLTNFVQTLYKKEKEANNFFFVLLI